MPTDDYCREARSDYYLDGKVEKSAGDLVFSTNSPELERANGFIRELLRAVEFDDVVAIPEALLLELALKYGYADSGTLKLRLP